MWGRIAVESTVGLALLVVLASPGSWVAFFEMLDTYTPVMAGNLALQFVLILATIHVGALVSVVLVGLLHVEVGFLIDRPLFRWSHAHRARGGKHDYFLSERALDVLTALHRGNLDTKERLLILLTPLARWGSFFSVGLTALILGVLHWTALSDAVTDTTRGTVGAFVGSHLDLLISATAFLLSLGPYVVLVVLLFSARGRRVRLRDNSQIVTDATQQLAQLELRITDVVDASYTARRHLIESRVQRAAWTVDVATGGRIGWFDGSPPQYLGEREHQPGSHDLVEMIQPRDLRVQREIERHVKAVRRILRDIEDRGLSQICEVATDPISPRLRGLHIEFRRRLKRSGAPKQPGAPTGVLAGFRGMVPGVTDRAHARLMDELRRDWDVHAPRVERLRRERPDGGASDAVSSLREVEGYDLDDLQDLADDDHRLHLLADLLEHVDGHIRRYCETIDRQLIHDGAREENLWKVRNFLNLHVLGGRMDTLVDRVH